MGRKRTKLDSNSTAIGNTDFGFLHIGKTAGSSVNRLAQLSAEHGYKPPAIFGHRAQLPEILRRYPSIKVGLIVRDPIERTISGFQSRMHQGRPTYSSLWSIEEAAAFAYFDNAADFLLALITDKDERLKSAALFAEKYITHVARNYAYHLKGRQFLEKHRDRIYFCQDLTNISAKVHELFEPCNIPKDFVDEHYEPAHQSGGSTEQILGSLNDNNVAALKKYFTREYRIYNYLIGISGSLPNSGHKSGFTLK